MKPRKFRHKPTVVEAMQFTHASRQALEAWLGAELNLGQFFIAESILAIETTQGDSRDIGLGGWVIKRQTRDGFEFYPVENEVIADDYEAAE